MNPETAQTITIAVKVLNGPPMFVLLIVMSLIAAGIWNLVAGVTRLTRAVYEIGKIYDEQVNGPNDEPSPSDLAP